LPIDSARRVGADALDGVALRLVEEVRVTLRCADAGMAEEAADQLQANAAAGAHAPEGFGWVIRLDTHPADMVPTISVISLNTFYLSH
jgi:hypothetical protein